MTLWLMRTALLVSTHSRPKAAGKKPKAVILLTLGFNTQPPEGGWIGRFRRSAGRRRFNTQPPEGGWFRLFYFLRDDKSFNTQPPEGGWPKPL